MWIAMRPIVLLAALLASSLGYAGWFEQTPRVWEAIQNYATLCTANKDCSAFADKMLATAPDAVCAALTEKPTDTLTKRKADQDLFAQAFSVVVLKVGADAIPACAQRYIPIPDER
ncbi:MAG TPA: hypothetical protein VF811_00250 [Parasulfuritortus sp.]